jgi:epoxyqueuosine reductase
MPLPNGPADSTQETEYLVKATSSAPLEQRLREEALRLGFATCGIAPAADDPDRAARLHQWLADGRHGSMEWMETRKEQRQGPQSLWPQAQSVIALGMSYAPAHDPLALAEVADRGRISVYAQGVDYHDVIKRALKALARWLVATEPGPK